MEQFTELVGKIESLAEIADANLQAINISVTGIDPKLMLGLNSERWVVSVQGVEHDPTGNYLLAEYNSQNGKNRTTIASF